MENKASTSTTNILVLGCGFGGINTLKRLVKSLGGRKGVKITLINAENYFLFSPLLHEAATGMIESRHIAFPIRRLRWCNGFNFVQAKIQQIDLNARQVHTTKGSFDYDYMVVALGSVANMSDLAASQHQYVMTLKSLYDARVIRQRIIESFEMADLETDIEKRRQLLNFVICGGGYTGVQLAADISEFAMDTLPKVYKRIDPEEIRVLLIESEQRIIEGLHPRLAAFVIKHLRRAGIETRLKSRVTNVWENRIEVDHKEIIPTENCIWVSGVVANPVVAAMDVEKDHAGRVLVNKYLELPEYPGVFALGDCAHYKEPYNGRPISPRAHNAVRQAKAVARNVIALARGEERRLYHYTNSAEIVSLGGVSAVMRVYGFRIYGLPARIFWYLAYGTLMVGVQSRIKLGVDWIVSWFYGRDSTLIKVPLVKPVSGGNQPEELDD